MSWATPYIKKLLNNEVVKFRPRGNSMAGKIKSGQLCHVEPIANHSDLEKGDIVLCKVGGKHFLHLITAIQGERFQIGNNHGHVNGWVTSSCIYGKCIRIDP